MIVYAFEHVDSPESAYKTIDLFFKEEDAEKALKEHKRIFWEDWKKLWAEYDNNHPGIETDYGKQIPDWYGWQIRPREVK